MSEVNSGGRGNLFTRFLTRRRTIDRMAVEVDDLYTLELHWSFAHVMRLFTSLVTTPVIAGLLLGTIAPTRVLVWMGFTTQDRYDKVWEFAHWGWVLLGQVFMCLVYYDLSVYVRYPFFKYALAPLYRRLGLVRPTSMGASKIEDLRSGAVRRKMQERPKGPPSAQFSSFVKSNPAKSTGGKK